LCPREHNQIKFDTETGQGCCVSFSLKKLDPQEIDNPVSAFGTPIEDFSQMTHMQSNGNDSSVFGMSDGDEGEKCGSLQMDEDLPRDPMTPDRRKFSKLKRHGAGTKNFIQCISQKDFGFEDTLKDDPLGSKMGWLTSEVNFFVVING
jgi:hypothetical protein